MASNKQETEANFLGPKAGDDAKITLNAAGVQTDLTTLGIDPRTNAAPSPNFLKIAGGNFLNWIADQDYFLEFADANQAISANAPLLKANQLYSMIPTGKWLLVKRSTIDGTLYCWVGS